MAATSEVVDAKSAEDGGSDMPKSYHEEFKEIDEVRSLIDGLKDVYDDLRSLEISCERFTCELPVTKLIELKYL